MCHYRKGGFVNGRVASPPGSVAHAGDATAVHVQSAEGEALSVLDTAAAVDSIVVQCNRKGFREKALQATLRKDHAQLTESFQANMARTVASAQPDAVEGEETDGADKPTIQVGV